MLKKVCLRDVLLVTGVALLALNLAVSLRQKKAEAETFRLDDCITAKPTDRPQAYLHVVAH
jgi:hypothetical protein